MYKYLRHGSYRRWIMLSIRQTDKAQLAALVRSTAHFYCHKISYTIGLFSTSALHLIIGTITRRHLFSMSNRVALVTAGSAGLGAQIARVLAPDFCVVCRRNLPLEWRDPADFRSSVLIT
jgi:hypothetical protein